MAEVLLGAFLQVLFDKLASPELLSFARRKNLVSELNKLKVALDDIKGVLEDAEDRDMSRETAVISWLDDLRDLAYDVDDLLDEFAIDEALRAAPTDRSGNLHLPGCCPSFLDPRRIKFNSEMTSKVKKINGRLDEIKIRKNNLGLKEGVGRNVRRIGEQESLRSTTSLPDSRIFGRNKEKEDLLKLVMDETQELSVIPIFGMAGSGKTTLAQSIYNDESVNKSFGKKAWACVSDEFNMVDIAKAIVQEVGGAHDKIDLNGLQVELQRCLSREKFLIVLDDVWSEDYNSWTILRKPFESSGVKGSKIIVTTRSQAVSRITKSSNITEYRLQNLSDGDSWALLAHHALDAETFDEYPYLKSAAEKIVNKCGGLPLATKSLGGMLRSSKELSLWKDIAESNLWDLPETTNSIPNALNLSYVYLPSHLKRCFVYCAVFPKDYEFNMDHLISQWMAEGLVKKPNVLGKSSRDVGLEYFQQLAARSFFQPSSKVESVFLMHDLMNDLAASKARHSCLSLGDGSVMSIKENVCLKKVRHLSLISQSYELSSRFEGLHDLSGLRTFLALNSSGYGNHVADKVIDNAFCHQKRLRVLSLCGYLIKELPNYIGSLRHLRYLNLSESLIQCLPTSISTLYNLETLILKDCRHLLELPSWITKLINLQCIDLSGTTSLFNIPGGIGNLTKLVILPRFIVGGENGARLTELNDLPFLAGELTIQGLCYVAEAMNATSAALNFKTRLTSLSLSWGLDERHPCPCTTDVESHMQVLNSLEPHSMIKKLEVKDYEGTMFPSWIGHVSFILLERVTLRDCRHTKALPTLGFLPALKEVIVQLMDAVCTVGPEFYGNTIKPFQCLETLSFHKMRSWEEWSFSVGREKEKIQFPRLRKLKLINCPKLKVESWPDQFPALVDLVIRVCPLLRTPAATSLPALESAEFGENNGRVMEDVVSSVRSLKSLAMNNVTRISELSKSLMRGSSSLTSLKIKHCSDMISLWEEEEEHIKRGVIIEPRLVNNLSLEIRRCNKLVKIGTFPSNLADVRLYDCENVEELPNIMPSSIKRFEMWGCKKVRKLPEGITCANGMEYSLPRPLPELEQLTIKDCPSLMPIEFDKLVPSLKKLSVVNSDVVYWDSSEIKAHKNYGLEEMRIFSVHGEKDERSLILPPDLQTKFASLTSLSASNYTMELECFPQLPGCLRELVILNCPGIKALPQGMHSHMYLQELSIEGCPGITSFPEEGLPPNLENLTVNNCENLRQSMSKWGFHRTTALKYLWIGGKIGCLDGIDTFPPPPPSGSSSDVQTIAGWRIVPPTLTILYLWKQENLVILSNEMHTHLTLLRDLSIKWCPKLQRLPREGFPASLCRLEISGANEELKKRLSKPVAGGLGDYCYFPFIQHIPHVNIR